MDILRRIRTSKNCRFTFDTVQIEEIHIPKTQIITIAPRKVYTAEQISFFLFNAELPYTEYLRLCKANEIVQVAYVDQKLLLADTNNGRVIFFDDALRHAKVFDYSNLIKINRLSSGVIVVPNGFNSTLNLSNAEDFFNSGKFRKMDPDFPDKKRILIEQRGKFVITAEPGNWNDVVAVFLDGSEMQRIDWSFRLEELCSKFACFYVAGPTDDPNFFRKFDVLLINVKKKCRLDGEVIDKVWERIEQRVELMKNRK